MEISKISKRVYIITGMTAVLSLGFRTGDAKIIQIWSVLLAVTSAGALTLAFAIPRYSKENQSTKLFSGLINLGLMILMFGASLTVLQKVNGLIAEDLRNNGPGQLMAECYSNTLGVINGTKIATILIKTEGVEETLVIEGNAPRICGAIFLIVLSYIVVGRTMINSIPQGAKDGFTKFILWIIILAIIGGLLYLAYRYNAWDHACKLYYHIRSPAK